MNLTDVMLEETDQTQQRRRYVLTDTKRSQRTASVVRGGSSSYLGVGIDWEGASWGSELGCGWEGVTHTLGCTLVFTFL